MIIAYVNRTIRVAFDYDPDRVELVRTIAQNFGASKAFDPETKLWKLPRSAALAVDLAFDEPDVEKDDAFKKLAEDAAEAAAQRQLDRALIVGSMPDLTAPLADGSTLLKHQQDAVRWMIERGSLILADDMGLGKTRMALVAADHYRKTIGCKIVLVCPAKLARNWKRESKALDIQPDAVWSWAGIKEPPNVPFVLIADEAHYAQNWRSQRTKKFVALAREAVEVWPMTGTPMPNGQPRELFAMLKAVKHPVAGNKSTFEVRYCDGKPTRFSPWDNSGASNLDELYQIVSKTLVRRKKKDCLDLPPKTRILRECEITPEMKEDYSAAFHRAMDIYNEKVSAGDATGDGAAFVALNFMRHAASIAKVSEAVTIANEIIQQGSQIVILTAFREPARRLASILTPALPAYTGEVTNPKTLSLIEQRFLDGKSPALVGTIKAAGTGLNLQCANTILLLDRPWKPGDAFQAEDRIQRIGQKKPTFAIWTQAFDVDRWVDDLLLAKEENIGLTLDGKKSGIKTKGIDCCKMLRKLAKQFELEPSS
jgi:SNF2 family DNA or RNA helicase